MSRQLRTIIGVLMIGIGLLQASLYAIQTEWIPTILGIIYSLLGIAFLWAEVYTAD